MNKGFLLLFSFFTCIISSAQITKHYDLSAGIAVQKVQKLYFENGIGGDFTSDFLLNKKIHIKAAYVTSRVGSALNSNAINQDNFTLGVDWHFLPTRKFQIFTGLNTGFFCADYENEMFNDLPNNSALFQFESGISYQFNYPINASLSFGYNFVNGDGISKPGTLFPVFYQLKVYYRIK